VDRRESERATVYLFTGPGIVPDDPGSATPPLASIAVNLDVVPREFRFLLAFVPAGTHTLAFTSAADDDDPEPDDTVAISAPLAATVIAGKRSR
jgi:hypothetical protein